MHSQQPHGPICPPAELLLVNTLHHQHNINSTTCWPVKWLGWTPCQQRLLLLQQAAPGTTPLPDTATGPFAGTVCLHILHATSQQHIHTHCVGDDHPGAAAPPTDSSPLTAAAAAPSALLLSMLPVAAAAAAPCSPSSSELQGVSAFCRYLAPVCCQLRVVGGRHHGHRPAAGGVWWVEGG